MPYHCVVKSIGRPPASPEERVRQFWSNVDQTGGPDACWPWLRSLRRGGYGQWTAGGVNWPTHRYAWVHTNGPIPTGMLVCHHCDNPPCCNPAHLFLGTHLANNRDKDAKGRSRYHLRDGEPFDRSGEHHGARKLTAAQVVEIRRLYAEGCTQTGLAHQFKVGQAQISRIVLRQRWQHV